jgi:hypothetical protein
MEKSTGCVKLWKRKAFSEFIIATILQDGEKINNSTDAQAKAQWLKGAMQRLAEQVPGSRIQRIREACTCCKGGLRNKLSKAIFKITLICLPASQQPIKPLLSSDTA